MIKTRSPLEFEYIAKMLKYVKKENAYFNIQLLKKCLIKNTIPAANEEEIMDRCLQRRNFTIGIVVYGMNANDHSVYNKQQQLQKMGFSNVHVYPGGLFEWLCLQDIYGQNEFPTTSKELDILKYKARSKFTGHLLEYNT